MVIGDIKEFQQGQLSKLEHWKKQEKRIKKGIYQMHIMIDSECTKTFTRENKADKKQTKGTQKEKQGKEEKQSGYTKTDLRCEMEKMLASANQNLIQN